MRIPLIIVTVALLTLGCDNGTGNLDDVVSAADAVTTDLAAPLDGIRQSDETIPDGIEPDVVTPESYYKLKLLLEQGVGINCDEAQKVTCLDGKVCCQVDFFRDLTGLGTKFAFGSTHIAPAIALAMEDTMYNPTFAVITLNFGIIIGTADKPAATNTTGIYDFGVFEPEIKLEIYNTKYSSKMDGSQGSFDITDWTADKDGLWAGTVKGKIVQDTDKDTKLEAYVEGEYRFILPEPAGGQ